MTRRHTSNVRHIRQRQAAAGLLLGLLATTACAGSEKPGEDAAGKPPAPLPSPSASKTPGTDPEQQAKDKALTAYRGFWDAQIDAFQKGSAKGTGLDKFAYGEARVFVENGLSSMEREGTRKTGKPSHQARVAEWAPEADGKAAKATISDCLDTKGWKTVERDSGKTLPLPEGQPPRFRITTEAEDWGERGWRMLSVTPSKRAC